MDSVFLARTRSEAIVEYLQGMASTPNATAEQAEKEFFDKHRPTSLLQRMAEKSEVASLVAYLASPLAAATNGASLRCEGGILRALFELVVVAHNRLLRLPCYGVEWAQQT